MKNDNKQSDLADTNDSVVTVAIVKEAVDVTTLRATLPCANLHPVRRHLVGGNQTY